MLAYNCSPSFNWRKYLDDSTIATFQKELGAMGYRVPVHHARRLARAQPVDVRAGAGVPRRRHDGLRRAAGPASSRMEAEGYTATRHQREVGAGYFDDVATVISGGNASTLALKGSTEEDQFH